MKLSDKALEILIPSKSVRKYVKNVGWDAPEEYILNRCIDAIHYIINFNDIKILLKEVHEKTKDNNTKLAIDEFFDKSDKLIEDFIKLNPGEFYKIKIYTDEDYDCFFDVFYLNDFNKVLKLINNKKADVFKVNFALDEDDYDCENIYIKYNSKNEIIRIENSYIKFRDIFDRNKVKLNGNICIPHPFRYGDIVKFNDYDPRLGKNRCVLAVVNASRDDHEMMQQINKEVITDDTVNVEYFDNWGNFYYDHVPLYTVEAVNLDYRKIEEGSYEDVIIRMSNCYKSKYRGQFFFEVKYAIDNYRNKNFNFHSLMSTDGSFVEEFNEDKEITED